MASTRKERDLLNKALAKKEKVYLNLGEKEERCFLRVMYKI